MARISGWVFIGIGFVVIAVSIFMYDTLKFFIVLGGIMTLYGLGKLTVEKMEKKFALPEDEGPIRIDERQNPYLKKHHGAQQQQQQVQYRQVGSQKQQQQQVQQQQVQHRVAHPHIQSHGNYCTSCGGHLASGHRFCGHCGARA